VVAEETQNFDSEPADWWAEQRGPQRMNIVFSGTNSAGGSVGEVLEIFETNRNLWRRTTRTPIWARGDADVLARAGRFFRTDGPDATPGLPFDSRRTDRAV
jgi:hypothetical protein